MIFKLSRKDSIFFNKNHNKAVFNFQSLQDLENLGLRAQNFQSLVDFKSLEILKMHHI